MSHHNTSKTTTCAVVGAGIVGLCTALAWQKRGAQVTLLDRDHPGLGASYGNAGYLATELLDPLGTPATLRQAPWLWLNPKGPLCLPWQHWVAVCPWLMRFVSAASATNAEKSRQAIKQLNRQAVPAWERLLRALGEEDQLVNQGYLLVWEKENSKAVAQAHSTRLQKEGIPCQWVTGQRLAELEPELSRQVAHGVYFPQGTRVRDPFILCQTLYDAFIRQGGTFHREAVESLSPQANRVLITTAKGVKTFDKAVLCTGAWTRKLLQGIGLDAPLEAERGYHLSFPGSTQYLRHPIGSADRRFVMTPLDTGLRAVGMSELGGLKLSPITKRYRVLQHHVKALLPDLFQTPVQMDTWMGHRPTLPDSLPVVDCHPDYPQLGLAFGHQHLGLTHAAISAELLLERMEGQHSNPLLQALRLNRFSERT